MDLVCWSIVKVIGNTLKLVFIVVLMCIDACYSTITLPSCILLYVPYCCAIFFNVIHAYYCSSDCSDISEHDNLMFIHLKRSHDNLVIKLHCWTTKLFFLFLQKDNKVVVNIIFHYFY